MSFSNLGFRSRAMRFISKAIEGPKHLGRCITIATLSVAETVLELVKIGIATDIARVKKALIRKTEAEADEKRAEADRKVAEAAEASNRATLHKRKDAIARAEKQLRFAEVAEKKAAAAKTIAESEKIRADTEAIRQTIETQRIEAIANGQARLIEAIAKLRAEGGDAMFSEKNLKDILRLSSSTSDEKTGE